MHGKGFVDQALTDVSNAWFNKDTDFIGDKIFPEVLVNKRTFKVWKYGKDNLRIPSSNLRTGRARAQEATFSKTTEDFGPLQEHVLSDFITFDEYQEDAPLNVETDTTENLNHLNMLIDEQDIATQLASTSIITNNTTLSGTAQWSDYTNSNPFGDIKTRILSFKGASLKMPNTVFMGWEVWLTLLNHPALIARMPGANLAVITEQMFVSLFAPYGIEKLYIGKAQKNTGVEGTSDTIASVWGKNFWLGYISPRPSRKEVNGGFKFRLRGGREVTREVFNNPKGTEILNRDYYDNVLMNADCFALIKDAIA